VTWRPRRPTFRQTDRGRRRFVRTPALARNVDDPHLYDLVINTDRMTPMAVACLSFMEAIAQPIRDLKASGGTESKAPFSVPTGGS